MTEIIHYTNDYLAMISDYGSPDRHKHLTAHLVCALSGTLKCYTEGTLQAAVEEMPAGYADKAAAVISNMPLLVVMLVLVIPIAILGMHLAEKALKKQPADLK